MSRLATLALLLVGTTAHADPRDHPKPIREQKSEGTATALAMAGAVTGAAMLVGGAETENDTLFIAGGLVLVLAPSAGHWYAGEPLTWGLPVRILGAAVATAASVRSIGCSFRDDCGKGGLVIGGLITLGAGALLDIATAGREARKYNERHWTVTPTVVSTGQSSGMGLGVAGAF